MVWVGSVRFGLGWVGLGYVLVGLAWSVGYEFAFLILDWGLGVVLFRFGSSKVLFGRIWPFVFVSSGFICLPVCFFGVFACYLLAGLYVDVC